MKLTASKTSYSEQLSSKIFALPTELGTLAIAGYGSGVIAKIFMPKIALFIKPVDMKKSLKMLFEEGVWKNITCDEQADCRIR
ncbi:hypothetical protein D9603_12255 [Pseudoalteromonas sp. PS5]|nr:hypothetical protein D9603_12255 [Pseudoalteromonas sp. PS5]